MRPHLYLGLVALIGAGPRAQSPLALRPALTGARAATAAPATTVEHQDRRHVVVHDYDVAQSRGLFAAADDNADDRLDLFETRAALQDLGDPTSPSWFRRLDSDRDGYLDWPEFDRFFHDLIRNGGTLHLRLCRPLPTIDEPAPNGGAAAPPASADRRLIALFDADHDGSLDMTEAEAMLRALNVPSSFAPMMQMLDTNRDGRFSEQELAPALQRLQLDLLVPRMTPNSPTPATGPMATGPMPSLWAAVDLDRSQSIDASELGVALRRIDPQLERWAARILAARDRNGDGRVDVRELPPTGEARPQAMVERSGKR